MNKENKKGIEWIERNMPEDMKYDWRGLKVCSECGEKLSLENKIRIAKEHIRIMRLVTGMKEEEDVKIKRMKKQNKEGKGSMFIEH